MDGLGVRLRHGRRGVGGFAERGVRAGLAPDEIGDDAKRIDATFHELEMGFIERVFLVGADAEDPSHFLVGEFVVWGGTR